MTTNCSNSTCGVLLDDTNRLKHRTICRECWRAQKRESRKLARLGDAATDPVIKARKKTAFLDELLRNGGFVERAIKAVGTSRRFINTEYNEDADFALLWETIVELGNESIESEIYRRAVVGVDKPLSYQGRLTGDIVKEWSDNLLIFMAKARMPTKYRDLPQKGAELTDDEINTQLTRYLEKRVGSGKAVPVIEVETVH